MTHTLLEVNDLIVRYPSKTAVNGLSFTIQKGEAVAVVGESGCGKSTTAMSILRLQPNTSLSGNILYQGENLVGASAQRMEAIRGKEIGMVFQDPMSSLNPVYTIGEQIAEALRLEGGLSATQTTKMVLELLDLVKIKDPQQKISAYPHQLSGGQRQRVVIAMAVARVPKLLIADEPTTALDAQVQLQILELLDSLRRELSMSLLLISHNLPVVSRWTDRVVVMHAGAKVEELKSEDLFTHASHPYTAGLATVTMRLEDSRHYKTSKLPEILVDTARPHGTAFNVRTPDPIAPPTALTDDPQKILDVKHLVVKYTDAHKRTVTAVDDVSLHVNRGETLGLVGESGSGKSSLSKAIMRLTPLQKGTVELNGVDITAIGSRKMRDVRKHVQMVFQDPFSSLNPRHTVGDILASVVRTHLDLPTKDAAKLVANCLDDVGLPKGSVDRYPFQFSGGQRQRIAIARAIILKPSLIICDEPVSALDVSVQAQILNLMSDLKQEHGLAYLFISHDLAVVQYMSDRIAVMQHGAIVEDGDHKNLWNDPKHAYTRNLIAAHA
ncbi:ABC transporter ATP-binding protein [Pseudomonas sp. v388]|uniref:dipeptide ABC transporter ATP-binding protein n=1 Tax=Pseudomonas sp. v388 TaxID=2479849 RepID=UPI000F7A724D|nr:ABC transporter ATP-binding protein [Pseudomonas sp. v388]RRV10463.1 ABC transporter ATP-binding protein [Pseudomonas sp. v388]